MYKDMLEFARSDVAPIKAFVLGSTAACVRVSLEKSPRPLDLLGADSPLGSIEPVTWHLPDTKSLRIAAEFLRLGPAPASIA